MKLFLHIGMEKTATTTVQNYFYENKDAYSLRQVAIITSLGRGNNRSLVSLAMNPERFDDYHASRNISTLKQKEKHNLDVLTNFESELTSLGDNINKVIITSEHFHSRLTCDEEVRRLHDILKKYFDEINVVLYLRPQVEVIQSLYSTILKSGGTISFEDFIINNPSNMKEYYDYESLLERWAKFFGCENILPRIFEKKKLFEQDIISDICNSIQIEKLRVANLSLNESLTPVAQEVVRLCNAAPSHTTNAIKNRILLDDESHGPGQSLNSQEAVQFQKVYDAANNRIAAKWFGCDILFDVDYRKYKLGRKIDASSMKTLSHLVNSLRQQQSLLPKEIDIIRDSALSMQERSPKEAIKLLEIASKYRPSGVFMRNKLKALREKVRIKASIKRNGAFILSEKQRIDYYLSGKVKKFTGAIKNPECYTVDRLFEFGVSVYSNDKAYYLQDLRKIMESMSQDTAIPVQCGDAMRKCEESVFIKARKVSDSKSILLKLNTHRHWRDYETIAKHDVPWEEKRSDVVWRGVNTGFGSGRDRLFFLQNYFGKYNVGFSGIINTMKVKNENKEKYDGVCKAFLLDKLSLKEQLDYKFIVSLEGNDVSTGLKWVLNSNSVPIMKSPRFETWMMEGLLEPYVHYLPLNESMDNLEDLLAWATRNNEQCKQIAMNGKLFMRQFADERNELSLQRKLIEKYLAS